MTAATRRRATQSLPPVHGKPVTGTEPNSALDECCEVPPPTADAAAPDDDTLARLAKALGHPSRLRILRLLTERNACVTGEVVETLELAQSTVSEHLRILREAGLIQGEIEGPRIRYCINADGLAALKAGIVTL